MEHVTTIDWTAWKRALRLFGTPTRPEAVHGEALFLEGRHSATCSLVPTSASFVPLLTPKETPLGWLSADSDRIPDDVFILQTPLVSDPRFRLHIGETVSAASAPLLFVNDLDPFGLAQWLALRYGTGEEELGLASVVYAGIDDAMIQLCDEWVSARPFDTLTIPLSPEERRLLHHMEDAAHIPDIVGERAHALLRSGRKLELEGALNPLLYRRGHRDAFFEHLRRRHAQK